MDPIPVYATRLESPFQSNSTPSSSAITQTQLSPPDAHLEHAVHSDHENGSPSSSSGGYLSNLIPKIILSSLPDGQEHLIEPVRIKKKKKPTVMSNRLPMSLPVTTVRQVFDYLIKESWIKTSHRFRSISNDLLMALVLSFGLQIDWRRS